MRIASLEQYAGLDDAVVRARPRVLDYSACSAVRLPWHLQGQACKLAAHASVWRHSACVLAHTPARLRWCLTRSARLNKGVLELLDAQRKVLWRFKPAP